MSDPERGVRKAEKRDKRREKRRPVHGKSLVHVMNGIKKRGQHEQKR